MLLTQGCIEENPKGLLSAEDSQGNRVTHLVAASGNTEVFEVCIHKEEHSSFYVCAFFHLCNLLVESSSLFSSDRYASICVRLIYDDRTQGILQPTLSDVLFWT